MFLDSAGNVSVVSARDGGKTRLFSFSAAGAIDAAFIDGEVIVGRAAISSNTPFLKISAATGETVPLSWPGQAGIMIQPGLSGAVYAAAFDRDQRGIKTSIIRLDTASPARSLPLAEFQGEARRFSIAESPPFVAALTGEAKAAVYRPAETGNIEIRQFERTPGFPVKLAGAPLFFICLDEEGNIAWYENSSGKLLAVFKLYENGWLVQS
jgi:hypothetical protein